MLASIGEDMLDSPVQSGAEDDADAPKVVKSRTESGLYNVEDASSRNSKFNDDDATNSQQHDDSAKSATEMNPDGA